MSSRRPLQNARRRPGLDSAGLEELSREAPPPDLIPASDKTFFQGTANPAASTTVTTQSSTGKNGEQATALHQHHKKPIETDVLHIRNDNLRAAKRRCVNVLPMYDLVTRKNENVSLN